MLYYQDDVAKVSAMKNGDIILLNYSMSEGSGFKVEMIDNKYDLYYETECYCNSVDSYELADVQLLVEEAHSFN